MQLKRKKYI